MDAFIVASTRPYIGKSGFALALLAIAGDRGLKTAYFKPYGTMPATVEGIHTDLDAAYISVRRRRTRLSTWCALSLNPAPSSRRSWPDGWVTPAAG
jgi:dethiobiotin synthetase